MPFNTHRKSNRLARRRLQTIDGVADIVTKLKKQVVCLGAHAAQKKNSANARRRRQNNGRCPRAIECRHALRVVVIVVIVVGPCTSSHQHTNAIEPLRLNVYMRIFVDKRRQSAYSVGDATAIAQYYIVPVCVQRMIPNGHYFRM